MVCTLPYARTGSRSMDYRYGSHTAFKILYHFVFVTKYRYQVLRGDIELRARELIRETCQINSFDS